MATELLYAWLQAGRPTVTTRELSRASGLPMSQVESAVMAEAEGNGAPWALQFTVSFKTEGVVLGVRRFQSRQDAQAFASEAADRQLHLHSVSMTVGDSAPMSMTELITRRFGDMTLQQRAASCLEKQDSYPLLSREATVEKLGSGTLAPQALKTNTEAKPAPAAAPVAVAALSAQRPAAVPITPPAPVAPPAALVKVEPPVAPVAPVPSPPISSSTAVAETTTLLDLRTAPAMQEDSTDTFSTPATSAAVSAASPKVETPAQPQSVKVQKSLFDLMKPTKRPRQDGEAESSAAPAVKPTPAPKKAPAAATAKAPKAKPLKETKSLAKLASRKGDKGDAPTSSMDLLDAEEQDSDCERDDEDQNKYMTQVLHTPPRPAADANRRGKAAKVDLSNVVQPFADDDEEGNLSSAAVDDIVLGEAATLIRISPALPAPAVSPKPHSSPGRFAPKTIAPQKRQREVEAPPIITGNLDSFFNTELFAFQQQYTHEHKSDCTIINGEYIFNDVTFYQHKETKETLTEEAYQAAQRAMISKFETERAEKKKLLQEASALGVEQRNSEAAKENAEGTKTTVVKQQPPAAKPTAKAAPANGPKQMTLFSFMGKKN